jgi:hypothetical protein
MADSGSASVRRSQCNSEHPITLLGKSNVGLFYRLGWNLGRTKHGCSRTSITPCHSASASTANNGDAPTIPGVWRCDQRYFRRQPKVFWRPGGTGILDGVGKLN